MALLHFNRKPPPRRHHGHTTISRKHLIDPYEDGRYPLFRFNGSVITRVFIPTVIATLWMTLIICVDRFSPLNLGISPLLVTIMSIVTGLILVFRTNTAYDRYWEGRRLWGQVHMAIRNAARVIWVQAKEPTVECVIIKKSAINLLSAFAYSTKHYLRREYAFDYDDLKPLIGHIPKYSTPAANIDYEQSPTTCCLPTPTNLPLEILLYLGSYFTKLRGDDHIDLPTFTNGTAQLAMLTECLTGFERILRSPIPLAYSIHLSHTIWLYLTALPFQLAPSYGWVGIPIQAIAAFTLLGIEAIGKEIENPFGYDYNDLPLDDFCNIIYQELEVITSQPPPTVNDWAMSEANFPFRGKHISAAELIRDRASLDEVRSLLSVNPDEKRQSLDIVPESIGEEEINSSRMSLQLPKATEGRGNGEESVVESIKISVEHV